MRKLPVLAPGAKVELIAPASRGQLAEIELQQQLLNSWNLHASVAPDLLGDDLLCANSDANRLRLFEQAIQQNDTAGIVSLRGGYGSMRLIPQLLTTSPPKQLKLFVGMSDLTALHLFLQQHWQWPTLHAALAPNKFSAASLEAVRKVILGEVDAVNYPAQALNKLAKTNNTCQGIVTGGNLTVVQASIGTAWQLQGQHKIIFLEEVGERAYRVDRMLEHLTQAGIFNQAVAIVFGDFTNGLEPNGHNLIPAVLQRFADNCPCPVLQVAGIGHANTNMPLPLGTKAKLKLGENAQITVSC